MADVVPITTVKKRDPGDLARLQGIQEMAEFLRERPELPLPEDLYGYGDEMHFSHLLWISSDEDLRGKMREIARAMGKAEKDFTSSYFLLRVHFSGNISYSVKAERERVCERRVIGTEKKVERVIKTPAEYEEKEVEKEIIEWDCGPILGK